jgi:hypothetical protein
LIARALPESRWVYDARSGCVWGQEFPAVWGATLRTEPQHIASRVLYPRSPMSTYVARPRQLINKLKVTSGSLSTFVAGEFVRRGRPERRNPPSGSTDFGGILNIGIRLGPMSSWKIHCPFRYVRQASAR